MINRHSMATLLAAVVTISTAAIAQLATPSYDLSWNTIDGGGGTSSGATYEVTGTIGQPDATPVAMTGGSYSVAGGFWAGGVVPIPTCPADIAPQPNGDGMVNIDDLVVVITHWGQTSGPADINHDNIVNIDDLVQVVTHWGMCP